MTEDAERKMMRMLTAQLSRLTELVAANAHQESAVRGAYIDAVNQLFGPWRAGQGWLDRLQVTVGELREALRRIR